MYAEEEKLATYQSSSTFQSSVISLISIYTFDWMVITLWAIITEVTSKKEYDNIGWFLRKVWEQSLFRTVQILYLLKN